MINNFMYPFCENLNLPFILNKEISIDSIFDKKTLIRPYIGVHTNTNDIINDEVMCILKDLGLNPEVIISFGHKNDIQKKVEGIVHTDIMLYEQQYHKVPFSINYELTDTSPIISWYDLDSTKEIYPPIRNVFKDDEDKNQCLYASGIHYGGVYGRHKENMSYNFKPKYQTHLTNQYPKLINTSLPHSVTYEGYVTRLSLSVRFTTEKKSSYDQALDTFKNFIVKEV